MQDVFTLGIKDTENLLPIFIFITREAFTLPISLIKAHQYEYLRNATLVYQGEIMMVSSGTVRLFRWTIASSLGLLTLLALLGFLPFFALGLNMQPTDLVLAGYFDPKGFPIYNSSYYGNVLYVLTIVAMLLAPFVGSLLSIFSGVWLLKQWRKLNINQRIIGGIALITSTSLLMFLLSPLGGIVYRWLLD